MAYPPDEVYAPQFVGEIKKYPENNSSISNKILFLGIGIVIGFIIGLLA